MNYDRAFELYMSGVELGQVQSFAGIAHMFEAGLGRSVDLQQAESWYMRGIEAGDEYAHSALAYMLLGSRKMTARCSGSQGRPNLVARKVIMT